MKNAGLQSRYIITKVNGNQMDPEANYFVLRLDKKCEPNHRNACLQALRTYATMIKPHLPQLAEELEKKYDLVPNEIDSYCGDRSKHIFDRT